MTRLTRKEMQQQTRQRLLEAAERAIAERGIEAASLRDIAEAAGYSLGAVYSNFESKEALLRELLATHMQKEIDLIRAALAGDAGDSPEDSLRRLEVLLRAMRRDELLSSLVAEFHLHANRNPAFRREFYESKKQRLAIMAEGLGAIFERFGRRPVIDPMDLAQGFSALWVGFAIQGRDGGGEAAEAVTMLFLEALLGKSPPDVPVAGGRAVRKRRSS